VLVPPLPGACAALGLLMAEHVAEATRPVLTTLPARGEPAKELAASLARQLAKVERSARRALEGEGIPPPRIRVVATASLRYVGQSFELAVPVDAEARRSLARRLRDAFHRAHRRAYGRSLPREVELVALRARAVAARPTPTLPILEDGRRRRPTPRAVQRTWFDGHGRVETGIFDRDALLANQTVRGPALISEYSATTLVPPGMVARVLGNGTIVIAER
ncbi:MAG: hypothetical protein ACK4N5_26685, partial [Myxococcales bacterium]